MATSRQLHRLATRPADYARYLTTGRLPEGVRPQGPLVTLLSSLSPRDLVQIRGLTVDPRLGYNGSRIFQVATQALHWIAPAREVFDGFPAESWRIKRFASRLTLEDVAACSASFPSHLQRYRALCRPSPRGDAITVSGVGVMEGPKGSRVPIVTVISSDDAKAAVAGRTEKPLGVDPAIWVGENGKSLYRARLPLTAFRANETGDRYDGTVDSARSMDYASRTASAAPPVIAGTRHVDGLLGIIDGGHRLSAARLRGDAAIDVIFSVPDGHALLRGLGVPADSPDSPAPARATDELDQRQDDEDESTRRNAPAP